MMAFVAPAVPIGDLDLADLHRAHYADLVRLAALLLDDVASCEDVVQEAFVALARNQATLRDPRRAPAYLRSAVLNGARSGLRRRGTRRRHLASVAAPEPTPSAESKVISADENRRVLEALRQLPDRQRDVLVLRYDLDLSEAEIAETLGIGRGSVKTHAHRGLARLADLLEEAP